MPRYSLLLAFPLLAGYEVLAFALSHDAIAGVRNGADVILKSLFLGLGGRWGVAVFGLVVVGGGAARVWIDLRNAGRPKVLVYLFMLLEAVGYALAFGAVAGLLTALLLEGLPLAVGQFADFDLATQLMISLGAGIYEELLFRVLLVGGLVFLARFGLGFSLWQANGFAVVVGALVFSLFHYVGPYGDPFEVPSFTFRAVAGLLFSGLYVTRGFGITAWTHALYDVFLTLAQS